MDSGYYSAMDRGLDQHGGHEMERSDEIGSYLEG